MPLSTGRVFVNCLYFNPFALRGHPNGVYPQKKKPRVIWVILFYFGVNQGDRAGAAGQGRYFNSVVERSQLELELILTHMAHRKVVRV